ncbi:MAG: hypothetical protein UW42_C0033G0010 [Candidatus Collierbacteria bacterium GW2011_GWB1_44_197]|nr:MAG: hypothetical protein UW42_C0033G0010 [Candidatus Collierbacteria bacterium GW2011_GWB1_44_197]
MRVSYTGITSAFQADERGPTPLTRSLYKKVSLAETFLYIVIEIEGGVGQAELIL